MPRRYAVFAHMPGAACRGPSLDRTGSRTSRGRRRFFSGKGSSATAPPVDGTAADYCVQSDGMSGVIERIVSISTTALDVLVAWP